MNGTIGTFTDNRDGQTYKTVRMPDGKIWMAENLKFDMSDDSSSRCYEYSSGGCANYGKHYDWNTAIKACPAGWHLPTKEAWDGLINAVGDKGFAGQILKSKSGWSDGGNGTDDFGFSALPGGSIDSLWKKFVDIGRIGLWWTALHGEDESVKAYALIMNSDQMDVSGGFVNHAKGLSVRCVKNY